MSYALLKACIEDQPATVSHLFALRMAEKIAAGYDNILPQVGKQIGSGAAFDYDAVSFVGEAVAEPRSGGVVGLTAKEQRMVGLKGEPPLATSDEDEIDKGTSLTGTSAITAGAIV